MSVFACLRVLRVCLYVSATTCQKSPYVLCCSDDIGPEGAILKTYTHTPASKVLLGKEMRSYPVVIHMCLWIG